MHVIQNNIPRMFSPETLETTMGIRHVVVGKCFFKKGILYPWYAHVPNQGLRVASFSETAYY